jgi:hypothetical protein
VSQQQTQSVRTGTQVWREVDELPGRALMRDGRWLV